MDNVSILTWLLFGGLIVLMLLIDMFLARGKQEIPSLKRSLIWTIVWTVAALLFAVFLLFWSDTKSASDYLTGYVIERSLSLDNLFVFTILFGFLAVPQSSQRKVLIAGIVGAIILRGLFILAGSALLENFHWMIYVFGAFLIFTGIRMAFQKEDENGLANNPALKFVKKHLPFTEQYQGEKLRITENGKKVFTPLMLALILVIILDMIFALDSIPAIFAITTDPFIVFAANAFSLLGMTSLFFLIADLLKRFHFLHYGLAFILCFVGLKMIVESQLHVPTAISLGVIIGTLVIAGIASAVFPKKDH